MAFKLNPQEDAVGLFGSLLGTVTALAASFLRWALLPWLAATVVVGALLEGLFHFPRRIWAHFLEKTSENELDDSKEPFSFAGLGFGPFSVVQRLIGLPERADYVVDRYLRHAPWCVFDKIWHKKGTYTFRGVPLGKTDGFDDYLYKKGLDRPYVPQALSETTRGACVTSQPTAEASWSDEKMPKAFRAEEVVPRVANTFLGGPSLQRTTSKVSRKVTSDASFDNAVPLRTISNPTSLVYEKPKSTAAVVQPIFEKRAFSFPGTTAPPVSEASNNTNVDRAPSGSKYINFIHKGKQFRLKVRAKAPKQQITASISVQETAYLEEIKNAIREVLDVPGYDDGSVAPIVLRLAWHCLATYDVGSGNGGSNGATMRFVPEITDEGNTGLDIARAALEPIKQRFPRISYSDLWTLGGKIAIEYMGGPVIPWRCGRYDCKDDRYVPPNGRLPFAYKGAHHIRETFSRMGFDDREAVVLCGAHGMGRCHKRYSGWEGKWTQLPTQFSNAFFQVLLEEKWELGTVPETGKQQYYNSDQSLMMLNTDMELLRDSKFGKWVYYYAASEEAFRTDFAAAFGKLLELGITRDGAGNVLPKAQV